MKFTLFDSVYDTKEDSKATAYLQKIRKWLDGLRSPEAIKQLRSIFLKNPFSQKCLVEGSNTAGAWSDEGLLLESSGFSRALFGKSDLDKRIDEACGTYERPEAEDAPGYTSVFRITKGGKMEETQHSKIDRESYEKDMKKQAKQKDLSEGNLSLDKEILAAFK